LNTEIEKNQLTFYSRDCLFIVLADGGYNRVSQWLDNQKTVLIGDLDSVEMEMEMEVEVEMEVEG
jgi:thiamine pyrophosphokinase